MSEQPAAGASGGKWKKGCGGCAVAGAAFTVVLVIIGVASSGSGKSSAPAASGHSPSAAPADPPLAKPRTVLTESGNGVKSTAKFTVPGDWDLRYSFGSAGNFAVTEGGALGEVLVNELAASGSDVTHRHDGGTKYLEINSECSWKVDAVALPQ
ncbi:hypothetical protein ACWCZ5_15770 [Streptomyces sp. NPDC001667]